jgi:hypothetical protein
MSFLIREPGLLRPDAQAPLLAADPADSNLVALELKKNGLVGYIDAFSFDGAEPMWMQEKAFGRQVIAAATRVPSRIASDPAFNGRPSFNFATIAHALRSDMRVRRLFTTQDFTFIAVMTRPTAPTAINQVLISGGIYNDGTTNRATRMFGVLSDGRLFFSNTGRGTGNFNNVAVANLPSGSTAAIYALTYRDAAKASQWRINNGALGVYSLTHTDNVQAIAGDETWIGHYSGASYEGWTAKFSQIFIFDRSLSFTNLQLLTDLMAALRTSYAIA